jgi:hypothetical protein
MQIKKPVAVLTPLWVVVGLAMGPAVGAAPPNRLKQGRHRQRGGCDADSGSSKIKPQQCQRAALRSNCRRESSIAGWFALAQVQRACSGTISVRPRSVSS